MRVKNDDLLHRRVDFIGDDGKHHTGRISKIIKDGMWRIAISDGGLIVLPAAVCNFILDEKPVTHEAR